MENTIACLTNSSNLFITDGGIETHMIYKLKRDLREFALFETLLGESGLQLLDKMYRSYINVAIENQMNIIIGSPTWRSNRNHMEKIGYTEDNDIYSINKKGVIFMTNLRTTIKMSEGKMFIVAGDVGPAGDGYVVGEQMTIEESTIYHMENIKGLSEGGAEVIQAVTLTYENEAAGIVFASMKFNLPVVVLFTIETDGLLPNGSKLGDAILLIDK